MDMPIRLGILSAGRIVRRVMRDVARAQGVKVTAVAARSMERAEEVKSLYGAQYAFDSYRALAECDEVDMVYVATPHNFHLEHSIMMMEAGKHVICEKPLAVTGDEARRMVDCARQNKVFLMEAMWTRFFPASYKLRELLAEDAIGRVRHFYADFAFASSPEESDRLVNPALAGGALLDVGIYAAAASAMVLGTKHRDVQGLCELTATGVDARTAVQCKYPSGATAQWMCAFDTIGRSIEIIYGSEGRIDIEDFWHPTALTLTHANGARERYEFEPEDEGYRHEFTHAAECVRKGLTESPIMPLDESIALADLLTELLRRFGVAGPGGR